ncbi:hypothetical protein C4F40_01920 [Sphingobacterium sp. Ka21]|uniref:Uncharacterized protein n=2 Tax=Sphingobacterium pedocola TaxID=2082722 RepID=A0ABR9T2B8_9SPHI|nr:hypothetical protein [Sphingobacterium pedocola]
MIKPFSDKSIYTHTMKEINTYHGELGGNKLPEALRANPFTAPPDYFSLQESVILSLVKLERLAIQQHNHVTPEGYFEQLQNNILAKVAEQKLKNQVTAPGFEVPQHYFEESVHQIQVKIFEETLRSQVTTTGLTIPVDYVDVAKDSILNRIAEEQLKAIIDRDGYEVPAAYFETLEQDIVTNIAVEKLKAKVTETGYHVPVGYFDLLSEKITADTIGKEIKNIPFDSDQDTGVITLPSRKNWTAYAAVAAVAVIISIGSYLSLNQQDNVVQPQNISLSGIPDEAIVSYLAQVSDANDLVFFSEYLDIPENVEIGNQVKDNDIEEYLNYML